MQFNKIKNGEKVFNSQLKLIKQGITRVASIRNIKSDKSHFLRAIKQIHNLQLKNTHFDKNLLLRWMLELKFD